MNKFYPLLILGVFIAAYFLGQSIDSQNSGKEPTEVVMVKSACNPTQQPCNISLAGNIIVYRILTVPSALKSFQVEVQAFDTPIDSIRLRFLMADMDMAKNEYYLVNKGNNSWRQEVILPVCSLRRKDWLNQLEIEYDGRYWLTEFTFRQRN
jgi:hypothetical protein